MRKKQRSVGDWPEVNRKPNELDYSNNAFDSMLNVTESDTLWSKDRERISSVRHKLDDGGSIKEKWFNHPNYDKAENIKTSEVEVDANRNVVRQTVYDDDGTTTGEATYEKGELRTLKEYYPDGSVKRDARALGSVDTHRHHVKGSTLNVIPTDIISMKEYYPDGSIKNVKQGNEQGVTTGKQESYYPNGNLKVERNFDDQGRRHGKHAFWKKDGSIRHEAVYDHGRIVSNSRLSKEEIDQINKLNGFN